MWKNPSYPCFFIYRVIIQIYNWFLGPPFKVNCFTVRQDFADRIATLPALTAKHKVIADAQHENAVDCILEKIVGHIFGGGWRWDIPSRKLWEISRKNNENVCLTVLDTFLEEKSERCWRCFCLHAWLIPFFFGGWWGIILVCHFCLITRVVRCTRNETFLGRIATRDGAESQKFIPNNKFKSIIWVVPLSYNSGKWRFIVYREPLLKM